MDNYSLLSNMRHASRFMLTISALLIFSYCFVFYSPSAMAMVDATKQTTSSEETVLLSKVTQNNKYLAQAISALDKELNKSSPSLKRLQQIQAYIAGKHNNLSTHQAELKELLSEQLSALKSNQTSNSLIKTTEVNTQQVLNEYQLLLDDLNKLNDFQSIKQLTIQKGFVAQLNNKLTRITREAPVHSYDNENLPFGPNSSNKLGAVMTQAELDKKLGVPQILSRMASAALAAEPDFPKDSDSIANIDAQFTEAIAQKAIELDSNPLTIYQWVYNNIRYLPSHGSIQGADYTLLAEQGNATDTASLLIALLRSSGTPARYAYGTVGFTPEQLQNWVGGVDSWEAAANLLGQGGIPVTEVSDQTGKMQYAAIEHTWVEAWVDNQWVSLDPSFKQYQYTQRMNLEASLPFDATSLQSSLTSGAENNESEGWVRGIDQVAIAEQLTQYQTQLEAYLNANHADATLGDLLGTQKIIKKELTELTHQLSYLTIHAQKNISQMPDTLRLKYRFNLLDEWGTNMMTYEASGPEVAGKRHALSYKPSTEADEQRLDDYLPAELKSIEQLPSSLPINLINLTPEWVIDGKRIKTASTVGLGAELKVQQGFYLPDQGWKMGLISPTNAGSYQAVGIDLQGISPKQLQALQAELEVTKSKLESEQLEGINGHDLTGNIMQTGILSYFSMTYAQDKIAAQLTDSIIYRQPSYGTFGIVGNVRYWFGLPKDISFNGVGMDVDNLAFSSEVKNNCHGDWLALNKTIGMRASAYEHLIPEMMFNIDSANPVEGVSAAKALAVAAQQNQKIYTLDKSKVDQLANITIDAQAKNEISNALNQGKIVTVHEKPINHFGWSGSGYIVTDSETGAGAYKISGGANGGWLTTVLGGMSAYLDGLTRLKDNWWNAGKAPLYAKLSTFLTVIAAIVSVADTVSNPDLSLGEKIRDIVINMGSAIVMVGISNAVMASSLIAVSNPIILGMFLAVIAITLSLLIMNLMLEVAIVDHKKRIIKWRYT